MVKRVEEWPPPPKHGSYEWLVVSYPHIYGKYPENLANRNWLRRFFSLSCEPENKARHEEWEKRMRAAEVLGIPPPCPPCKLIMRGG